MLTTMWRFYLLVSICIYNGCGKKTPAENTPSTTPTPPANVTLEQRNGLYYKPESNTPLSGSLLHKHKNGNNSFESVYLNGMKLLQRSWHANGVPREEYRFHQGHIVVRRDWDHTGKLQTWRNLNLLAQEQFTRATQFAASNPPDWEKAYLWFHIAGANGHLDSRRFLSNQPEKLTPQQVNEIKVEAERLLGLNTQKTGNLSDQNASIKK